MSDTILCGLYAVHEPYLTNCFGEEVSARLAGRIIPRSSWLPERQQGIARDLSIGSRNDWFRERLSLLLDRSGLPGLRFITGSDLSCHHTELTRIDGRVIWEETRGYKVLNPDCLQVIADIERLEQWCLAHPDEAGRILDIWPQDLRAAHDGAFFTLHPDNEGLGEGDNAGFVFCVLRTMKEVLRFAQFHRCWAVYWLPLAWGPPAGD